MSCDTQHSTLTHTHTQYPIEIEVGKEQKHKKS